MNLQDVLALKGKSSKTRIETTPPPAHQNMFPALKGKSSKTRIETKNSGHCGTLEFSL